MSPKIIGALRAVGVLLLVTLLGWIGDATNLTFLENPWLEGLIAAVALAIEHQIENKTGRAIFGAVKSGK